MTSLMENKRKLMVGIGSIILLSVYIGGTLALLTGAGKRPPYSLKEDTVLYGGIFLLTSLLVIKRCKIITLIEKNGIKLMVRSIILILFSAYIVLPFALLSSLDPVLPDGLKIYTFIYSSIFLLISLVAGIALLFKKDWAVIITVVNSSIFCAHWFYFLSHTENWLIVLVLHLPSLIFLNFIYFFFFGSFQEILQKKTQKLSFPYLLTLGIFGVYYLFLLLITKFRIK